MWILLILVYGGLFFWIWYRKNGEKLKSKMAEKNIEKKGVSLKLSSEAIDAFLNSNKALQETEINEAVSYLKAVKSIFNNAVWAIDSQNAVFKTKNRTKDRLLSVRGTCDLYVSDKLIYTLDFTRANIPANGSIEIKQDIQSEYSNAVGALSAIAGAFSKKLGPKTEGRFRNYEIELAENHYLFENPYIRKIAGEKPIVKEKDNLERLNALASTLEGNDSELANSIITILEKAKKYAEGTADKKNEVKDYIDKYIPTINEAISSYHLDRSEESHKNLTHTLEIMNKATKNFYAKLIEIEVDTSEVNQTVLEQQLMREGLYSPYGDDFFE